MKYILEIERDYVLGIVYNYLDISNNNLVL